MEKGKTLNVDFTQNLAEKISEDIRKSSGEKRMSAAVKYCISLDLKRDLTEQENAICEKSVKLLKEGIVSFLDSKIEEHEALLKEAPSSYLKYKEEGYLDAVGILRFWFDSFK